MKVLSLYKGAFTLIELLVVISIIALLASIVFASLDTTREKARDASAKSTMSSLRAEAELFVTSSGYPTNLCTRTSGSEGPLDRLLDKAEADITGPGTARCNRSAAAWAAAIFLHEGVFCVDSTGYAGTTLKGTSTPLINIDGTGASALGLMGASTECLSTVTVSNQPV